MIGEITSTLSSQPPEVKRGATSGLQRTCLNWKGKNKSNHIESNHEQPSRRGRHRGTTVFTQSHPTEYSVGAPASCFLSKSDCAAIAWCGCANWTFDNTQNRGDQQLALKKVKKLLHNPLSLLGRVPALIERDFRSVHCTRLKSCNCMACLGSCALPVHLHSHDFTIAGENLREQLNILNAKTFVIVGTSSWHMLAYVGTFRTSSSVS